ncbi:MAG: cobalamin-binding protein [Chloroflexi bacterium]|nr:cobalamin-binding protein [Chloroflexota bacterium]
MKTVILAPLDPVHDNAVKLIKRKLTDLGYDAIAMRPGTTVEEVIQLAQEKHPAAVLVSRTLGYKVAETLSRLIDLADAAGVREQTRFGVGGMALTKETGAELGFDATFIGELDIKKVVNFIEGKQANIIGVDDSSLGKKEKPDIVAGFSYEFRDKQIERLLDQITDQILVWAGNKNSNGVERAKLRAEMIAEKVSSPDSIDNGSIREKLQKKYIQLCDPEIQAFYHDQQLPAGVRWLSKEERENLPDLYHQKIDVTNTLRHNGQKTLFFAQYGTGCPIMDVVHIRIAEAWGIDGVLHFDPSWGAQKEGLLEGYLSHEHDGTILTLENLKFIKHYMESSTIWNVRGHRGLNTPETQVLAHAAGADILKINIPYGSTGGGTDPARLTVDGLYSLRLAAEYGLPFDIPGNDELSGVPPHKTFAGLLIMMALGLKLGAKPIPKPLMCLSPYMTIYGRMDDNFVDMNLAKLSVWQDIIDTPVWPGEPIGFMTHTPERVQSSMSTALHAALACSAGVTAATIASSDEAYSKGPISSQARVDTLRAVKDALRFVGNTSFQSTPQSQIIREEIHQQIIDVLKIISGRGDFVASIYEGHLGNEEDGLFPGRTGKDTIIAY